MMLEKMVTGMVADFVMDSDDGPEATSRICSVIATAILTLMNQTVPPEKKGDPENWLDPQELWDALGAVVVPTLSRDAFAAAWREIEQAQAEDRQPNLDEIEQSHRIDFRSGVNTGPIKRLLTGDAPDDVDPAVDELDALFNAPAFGEDFGETVPEDEDVPEEEL